jgi:hypothetical protein
MPRTVLSEWLLRAGFSVEARRCFRGGNGVLVVEQAAVWHDAELGAEQERRLVGSRFQVRDGRVASYVALRLGSTKRCSRQDSTSSGTC